MATATYYLQPQTQTRELLKQVGGLRDLCSKYDIPAVLGRAAGYADFTGPGYSPEQSKKDAEALRELALEFTEVTR